MKQVRFSYGKDLLEEITEYCIKNDIKQGYVNLIGALQQVAVGFYNQDTFKYEEKIFKGGHEIVSCSGNISIKEGKPFAHIHLVVSDENYQVKGGHMAKGNIIFAAECTIFENKDTVYTRKFDETTKLALW